ncbi:MAG: TonB-dependent receptor [Gemmatimonadales bacterium]
MRTYLNAAAVVALVVMSFMGGTTAVSAQNDPHPDSVYVLDPIDVQGRADDLTGLVSTASVGFVGARDLRVRPLLRAGELLETVPGMILTQHSGGGKSNQMFVRGFNLDHGTDFSTKLEGMPINLPTHAHGHGYTDLNFLIPELVDHVEYSLGNFYAEIGDFGSAGGAEFRLRRSLNEPILLAGFGENGYRRVVAGASTPLGSSGTLLAGGELEGNDGPWDLPEDLQKLSGMLRYTHEGATSTFSILALGYDNEWNASDQIPRRAVENGTIGRFGNLDSSLGGASSRYSAIASWNRATASSSQKVEVYGAYYELDLFSNFTYELDDPADGDQFRQQDHGRTIVGANLAHLQPFQLAGREHTVTLGAQLRGDMGELTLSRTRQRTLVSTIRNDEFTQWSGGAYAELKSPWSDVFRTTLGLRADAYAFDVTSDLAANTGTSGDQIVSPKLSLAFGPFAGTELYVSGGLGFHSNDARGTVTTIDPATGDPTEPVDALVRSWGGELGARSQPVAGLNSTLSLWALKLDSELLFVGDAGTTEPSGATRRMGVTFANFYRITDAWSADLDVSFTKARLLDVPAGEDRIPGALERVVAAGFGYEPAGNGPFGTVRLRHFGEYPLIEDNSVRSDASALVNLSAGYKLGSARVTVQVLNVLDEADSDIQYFYTSRLPGEPPEGVDDVHFHPSEPRELRVSLSWGL